VGVEGDRAPGLPRTLERVALPKTSGSAAERDEAVEVVVAYRRASDPPGMKPK
jgi:hypothetical protein